MSLATITANRHLVELLGSRIRACVITWLFLHPDEQVFLRDLAAACGVAVQPLLRQMQKLERLGLVESEIVGRARSYRLRAHFPEREALSKLVEVTSGVMPLLREALERLPIQVAFVFGSVAEGTEGPQSDVDLMVIGEVSGPDLHQAIWEVETKVGREVNQIHYAPTEFAEKAQAPSAFLSKVLRSPKTFVIGDEDGLRELTGAGNHQAARTERG